MPSANISLGRYVVLKPRADGSGRAYFQVPTRQRPDKWPATVPLCREIPLPSRVDDLTPNQLAAVVEAGRRMSSDLDRARFGVDAPKAGTRTLQVAITAWKRSSAWHDIRPKTRTSYVTQLNKIEDWSRRLSHPDPTHLSRAQIETFLSLFNDRPTTKRLLLVTLRQVMDQVVALGWRTDNPCVRIRVKRPKTRATIWEQADVDTYVAAARAQGRDSLALIILLQWEIGQRLTDVRAYRPGREYDSRTGTFSFEQSKTDAPVQIQISAQLRELLRPLVEDGQLFLFRNERTGKAYEENALSKAFGLVRKAVVKAEGRALILKHLRHSCVVQLARAGCTAPEIAAITGHTLASVNNILMAYLPRDSVVALNAQIKRGIVVANAGRQ